MEYTFAMIKANACYAYAINDIIGRIEEAGLTVVAGETRMLEPDEIRALYSREVGKPNWEAIAMSVTGRVYCMALRGENAVKTWWALMGDADPSKAAYHTLRGLYGSRAGNPADNGLHGSDSITSATLELALMFPDLVMKFKEEAV